MKKEIQVTLAHEFWRCSREFNAFIHSATKLILGASKEERLEAFTAYGNFVHLFYSFYEGIIKYQNLDLIADLKPREVGPKISALIVEEVKKMITNQQTVYASHPNLDNRELQHLVASEVPDKFGDDFRRMRNRFAHSSPTRVSEKELTLLEFYHRYHKYLLLMYRNVEFSWRVKSIEGYDWAEIDNFLSHLKGAAKS